METLGLDPSIVLLTLINFAILVLILKHFLWDKIKTSIDERQNYIEEKISKADEAEEKARIYLVENKRILSTAKDEGNKIIESKKKDASKVYDEIVNDANKEAKAVMERAKVEIERQKEKAEAELRKEVVNLAIDLSTKALEEKVEESTQRSLINDFINEVGK
ncbi:F-type H+-transporting ATPase subunit b [Clostridium sp. DSM 8431]|uniref:F0F1 ATP synthase subunit B n=1 Tax=Clostridium sp. DSM 8431 TaxID=1761781 RepID=UPI0008F19AE3|nr:F0F1 ATP synthase subunit B [Clostridium sp. DSM 8431]SFU49645.1 F-type H+-transporting ATPase subunit b [Clostridium sp. DSM 8431]